MASCSHARAPDFLRRSSTRSSFSRASSSRAAFLTSALSSFGSSRPARKGRTGSDSFPSRSSARYPAPMKISDVLRLLQDDGWYLVATRGSHRQFKHESKPGRVTVAGKPSDDLAPGTLNSIFKQAGLRK